MCRNDIRNQPYRVAIFRISGLKVTDVKDLFTGKIEYKENSFTFVFDGNELELIPDDSNVVFSLAYEDIAKGVYTFSGFPTIEEAILTGICNETNRKIIFIFKIGSYFRTVNNILYIKPRAYIS